MMDLADGELAHLDATERHCVRRYILALVARLGDNLVEARLFGSASRGDMWSSRFPINSDIDLLVLTRTMAPREIEEELINETYPLYLECGRQIAPQWRTIEEWSSPPDERAMAFKLRVDEDSRKLYGGR